MVPVKIKDRDAPTRNRANPTARLEARIGSDLQKRLKRAAELEGRSVTDYVITAVEAATRETIERASIMRLSDEASRVFADALLNPRAPNKALKQAAARRRKLFGAS
jgi:uncharacterized protein (DUF1778 family)